MLRFCIGFLSKPYYPTKNFPTYIPSYRNPIPLSSLLTRRRSDAMSADNTGNISKEVETLKDSVGTMEINSAEDSSQTAAVSKKAAKKEAAKAERLQKRMAAASASAASQIVEEDPALAGNYGDVPFEDLQSKVVSGRKWTKVSALDAELQGKEVLVRGRAHTVRAVGNKMSFIVLRESGYTVQCVVTVNPEFVSKGMVKYVNSVSRESIVDVCGIVSVPNVAIKGASQQVEIQVRKLYVVNKAAPTLPINLDDAARSEEDIRKAEQSGEQVVKVGQDTRLNNRVIDIRTPANQAIFRVQSKVSKFFRDVLDSEGFVELHTPKLMAGSSEGGSAVFTLKYKGQDACLAQSPQLHKQMAICGDFGRVFEIGPVFRAEDSYTHRHLCEFTGLDLEMEIKEHYFEVLDVVDKLFVSIFDGLNEKCKKELDAIGQQYPFKPLKYLRNTLRLTYAEGLKMLKDAGLEIPPFSDLNTEAERKLGELVKNKHDTDFYILHRYPSAIRPFYTMPCVDDANYSNSFDVFIRGEEIISGAQRIHEPELLAKRAGECGIAVNTISAYIDSFRWGAPPHGGIGVGLERVVMLFCGLNNIRKTSLFPRDPQRLAP